MQKYKEAADYLFKALECGVQDKDVYFNRVGAEFHLGNFDVSVAEISKAIDISSKDYSYYLLRARSYDKKGVFDKAFKDYEKALKFNDSNAGLRLEQAR